MGGQKKSKKEGKPPKIKKSHNNFSMILWAALVPIAACLTLLLKQTIFSGKIPDSYDTAAPETVNDNKELDEVRKQQSLKRGAFSILIFSGNLECYKCVQTTGVSSGQRYPWASKGFDPVATRRARSWSSNQREEIASR